MFLVSSFSGRLRFISFGPRRGLAYTEHSLHQTKVSPFGPTLFYHISCTTICAFLQLFSLEFGPSHNPDILIFLLLLPHLMQQHLLLGFVKKSPLYFRLQQRLFSTNTVNTGCVLQCRATLLSSLLNGAGLVCALLPPSNIAPSFANSSAFLLPSVTHRSKSNISYFFLGERRALTYVTSRSHTPHIGIIRCRDQHTSFIIHMSRGKTDSPSEETKESRQTLPS